MSERRAKLGSERRLLTRPESGIRASSLYTTRVAGCASQIDALIGKLRETSRRADSLAARHVDSRLLQRPGEGRWCAAECVAHLNLGNRAYLPRLDEALGILREKKLAASGILRLDWNARLLKYWLEPPSWLRLPTGAPFQPIDVNDAAAPFDEFSALNRQLEDQLGSARGLDLGGAKIVSPFALKRENTACIRRSVLKVPRTTSALVASGECSEDEYRGPLIGLARSVWTAVARTHVQQTRLVQFQVEFLGALQGIGNAETNVAAPDVVLKFGLMQETGGLLSRTAKNEAAPGTVDQVRQILQSLQAGGVDRRHVSQAQNDDRGQIRKAADDRFDLVCRSEEKRPVNAEDRDVRRDVLVLQDVGVPLLEIVVGHFRYRRRRCDFLRM